MSESRKAAASGPAEIAARIEQRRHDLAVTLDEIGVRIHPRTMVIDARNRAVSAVDRSAGRAYVVVNRTVSDVRSQLVTDKGAPRLERLVPVTLVAVGLVGLLVLSSRRRRR